MPSACGLYTIEQALFTACSTSHPFPSAVTFRVGSGENTAGFDMDR